MKGYFMKHKSFIPRILLVAIMLFMLASSVVVPINAQDKGKVVVQETDKIEVKTYDYPEVKVGRDYYQVMFPTGLVYSSAWAGTFAYMPNNMEVLLYDDSYSEEFGLCIFSLPHGSTPPSGAQGGTSLTSITSVYANSFIKGYSVNELAKPYSDEIIEVMPSEHKYVGAWAGEKLAQKFRLFGKQ